MANCADDQPEPPPGPAPEAEPRERAQEVSRLFREHNRALVSFVRTRVHN